MQRILPPQTKREIRFHALAGRAAGRTLQSADRKAGPCDCLKGQAYTAYAEGKEAEGAVRGRSRWPVFSEKAGKGRRQKGS